MRLRRAVASGALAGSLFAAAPARAQYVDWRASIGVSGSYNQSISDSPYPTTQTYAGPALGLTPTIVGVLDTPRTDNTLTYAFTLTAPLSERLATATTPLTYSNRLTYTGRFALSELTTMQLSAGLTQSPITGISTATSPTEAAVETAPTAGQLMLQLNATEGITRQLPDSWTFNHSIAAGFGCPIDPTLIRARTSTVQNAFGISHTFTADTLGITLSNQLTYVTPSEAGNGQVNPDSLEITNTAQANWLRPLTQSLGMAITAGATQVVSPKAETKTLIQPSGSFTLNYGLDPATVSLAYVHNAMPNLATGQTNFMDTGTLRFTAPFAARTGLSTQGSFGYTRSIPIGGDGTPQPATHVFVADAALSWAPPFTTVLTGSLRGQFQRQLPTADPTTGFTRYSITLTLTYSYPSNTAAPVRPRLSPVQSVQPPSPVEINTSDRLYTDGFNGPAPAEAPPQKP